MYQFRLLFCALNLLLLTFICVPPALASPFFSDLKERLVQSERSGSCFCPELDLPNLVEKLLPAVVNISSKQTMSVQKPNGQFRFSFPQGSPFEEFNQFFDNFGGEDLVEREATSLGSGFIIDPEGYIVTNYHVIDNSEEITINLSDDTKYQAKLVGYDTKTDLALLKVDASEPLPYVSFGDSDKVRVGDSAVVIGNPFGLGGTVTTGIISARARDIKAGPFDDFLQTDASINRGNSGGPTFNLQGEVIGINTYIVSPSGGSVGIGFAIPSALCAPVIKQLKETGKVSRPWLGVKIQDVSEDIAESLGLKSTEGAFVAEILPNSPAHKAGIQVGDIILQLDEHKIKQIRTLTRLVADHAANDKVKLLIWRKGKQIKQTVNLEQLVESDSAPTKDMKKIRAEDDVVGKLGLSLAELTPSIREKFAVPKTTEGVVVTKVLRGTEAHKRGIRTGDVISSINQESITTYTEMKLIVDKALKEGKKSILFLVSRRGETGFVALSLK